MIKNNQLRPPILHPNLQIASMRITMHKSFPMNHSNNQGRKQLSNHFQIDFLLFHPFDLINVIALDKLHYEELWGCWEVDEGDGDVF